MQSFTQRNSMAVPSLSDGGGKRKALPEEMTREVARIYNSLPPEQRARTAIFANSYGQAGAIDFFGPKYGLPKSISNHQSYWLWGPREFSGETVIVLGSDGERLA